MRSVRSCCVPLGALDKGNETYSCVRLGALDKEDETYSKRAEEQGMKGT